MKTKFSEWLLIAAALCVLALDLMPAAALAEQGPQVEPGMSALNPNRLAPDGFIAPTLDGKWRFRAALNGWLPNVITIGTDSARGGGELNEDLGWLFDNLRYIAPIDFEVRKGSFGAYLDMLFLGLGGRMEILGPVTLDWDVDLWLFDVGFTYELGRWRLWDHSKAPELTLEPYFEARIVHLPIAITLLNIPLEQELSSAAPVLGMRAFIDFTEHWNLELFGDYGGWGVDNNHQTWQAVGLIGYRWKGWGGHWNLQAGYRAMRLFERRGKTVNAFMDSRGANLLLGVEF